MRRPVKRQSAPKTRRERLPGKWKKPARFAAAAAAALLLFCLCLRTNLFGMPAHVAVYPVRGQVLFEGRATPNANILLEPVGTKDPGVPRPHAIVKDDGSFVLGTYGNGDGAPVGDYKVLVQWFAQPEGGDFDGGLPPNLLPARYGKFETSGLSVHVQKGDNQVPPFELHP